MGYGAEQVDELCQRFETVAQELQAMGASTAAVA